MKNQLRLVRLAAITSLLLPVAGAAATIYVTEFEQAKVMRVTDGAVSTFVTGTAPSNVPQGVAVASNGNIFVGIANKIRQYTPDGNFTLFASSDPAWVLAAGPDGSVYSASSRGVYRYTSSGTRSDVQSGEYATGIAPASDGSVYVVNFSYPDLLNYSSGGSQNYVAFDVARDNSEKGLALDGAGNIFVSDSSAGTIFKVSGSTTTVFASGLHNLEGIAVDASGTLYAAATSDSNTANGVILAFTPNGTQSTFATGLNHPQQIAIGPDVASPEPGTISLMLGGAGLLGLRRLRRRTQK